MAQRGGRVGLPLRGKGKIGRGQRWKMQLGKLKLDNINFSAKRNAFAAAEDHRQQGRVYCLSKRESLGVVLKAMSNKVRVNHYRVAKGAGSCTD